MLFNWPLFVVLEGANSFGFYKASANAFAFFAGRLSINSIFQDVASANMNTTLGLTMTGRRLTELLHHIREFRLNMFAFAIEV